jgi:hypothetical protein
MIRKTIFLKNMKKNLITMLALLFVFGLGAKTVISQFTIKIPKIPKIDKPKTVNPSPSDAPERKPSKSGADAVYKNDRPTAVPVFLKNSIYIQAVTHNEYWKMKGQSNFSSWVPAIRFGLFYNNEKPIDYVVEYSGPDGSLWLKDSLERTALSDDRTITYKSQSPYGGILDTKSTNATGVYSFKIINQTTGQADYQGKFKVGKFSASGDGRDKNKFDFYVDHDWLLPFGMIGFHHSDIEIGGIMPEVSVWLNGLVTADELEGRLFYQGKQIATTKEGRGVSGVSDYDERMPRLAPGFAPEKIWKRWQFQWDQFRFDNNGGFNRDNYPNVLYADKNPGEYAVKIYRNGVPIRELSFTVGADGKFAAPAWTKQIPLPYHRVILPVKIIGATEKVNAAAWKTDAFYGNPLNGFSIQ